MFDSFTDEQFAAWLGGFTDGRTEGADNCLSAGLGRPLRQGVPVV